jgi:ABC-2 type transport system ATP-binding protein
VLELIDLSRRYGDTIALDGLSFTVEPRQLFGFVGPNGAGKTTAMRIVLGVLEPGRGEVRWQGRPVDAAMRRRFGYMPEERGLYPKMHVRDQIVYFARLHGHDPASAAAAESCSVRSPARSPSPSRSIQRSARGPPARSCTSASTARR